MNRYTAAGLTAEARTGKRIIVLSRTLLEARHAQELCENDGDVIRISRGNGAGAIHYANGGYILFRSAAQGLHGYSADTIYLEPGADVPYDLAPLLATSTTPEVIRA